MSTGGPDFFFVANQSLALFPAARPSTYYHFSRLAWANSTNESAVYVYRQLNESMLAEDAYIDNVGWNTELVNIPMSNSV